MFYNVKGGGDNKTLPYPPFNEGRDKKGKKRALLSPPFVKGD
jgi:hypothetical protein